MNLRFLLALWAGKLSVIALRALRRRGTVLPGRVAMKICPDFLKYAPYPEKVIAVTGTNGKTTVTNMLHDLLTADGQRVLTNQSGANMEDGLAAMVVRGLSLQGKCRHDICVYEVDEHWTRIVFPRIRPGLVLVTNLARDTISDCAHPEYMQSILTESIPKSVQLILNADDLFSSFISPENPRVYFGVDALPSDARTHENFIHDALFCPICGRRLIWDALHYSDIGRARCPNCNLRSPEREYLGMNIDVQNRTFELRERDGSVRCPLPDLSTFNIYNAVAAATILRELNYERERIAELFSGLKITESRLHCIQICGAAVHRILLKPQNPVAGSRVCEYIRSVPGDKEIVFMCQDVDCSLEYSENIAWSYDCDFELLNVPELCGVVLYGSRSLDYKLRFLLAGISEDKIKFAETVNEIPDQLRLKPNGTVFILHGITIEPVSRELEARIAERLKEKLKV